MTLPLRKRSVSFYELLMESTTRAAIQNPATASLPAMLACFSGLITPKTTNLPLTIRKSTNLHTVLADWDQNAQDGHFDFLLSKANAALSDVALRDMNTARLRKAGKTRVEGIEESAHGILRPNTNPQTALILLTTGAGVGPGDIERLFRKLAKIAATKAANKALFYFDDPSGARGPDGAPLQYKVGYRFSVLGHKGQTLDSALRLGRFESMELIALENERFDEGGNFHIDQRTLRVSSALPETVTAAGIRNVLREFRSTPDGNIYDKLRLRFTTVSGKDTSTVLALNALDAAFTLREHIEFDTDLESQQASISPTILAGMKPLLDLIPR